MSRNSSILIQRRQLASSFVKTKQKARSLLSYIFTAKDGDNTTNSSKNVLGLPLTATDKL